MQSNKQQPHAINPEQMVALVGSIIAQPKTPSIPIPPPRRWDSVVRQAVRNHLGPIPDPWRVTDLLERVALNPQPLPPRVRLLIAVAEEVIGRAEMLHEFAGATSSEGDQRAIIIIGGYISEFVDEVCGNGFRFTWPFPGPPPHWFATELGGSDLLVLASQFADRAARAFGEGLRDHLSAASAKFAGIAVSRIESQ